MYEGRPDLQKWAAANPMLAQREFMKRGGAPASAENIAEFGARAQEQGGYAETMLNRPGLFGGTPGAQQIDAGTNFSVAANAVPAPWNVQGAMVDLNRGAPALFAAQAEKTNPMNASSQEMPVGDRTREFLQKIAK
jgi:hypothetical protein